MNIGDLIKDNRKKKGLTQDELAALIGISKNGLWNYENNKRKVNTDLLQKIAEVLNIPISEFVEESPLGKLQSEIRLRKETLFDLNLKSDEIDSFSNALLEELRNNPSDKNLIDKLNKSDAEFQAIQNQISYIKHEYDELITDLRDYESRAATYKEFGDIFTDEKDIIEGKKLLEEIDNLNKETLQDTLLIKFDKLNSKGKFEAIKRVDELTQIPTYTKDETFIINYDEADKENSDK